MIIEACIAALIGAWSPEWTGSTWVRSDCSQVEVLPVVAPDPQATFALPIAVPPETGPSALQCALNPKVPGCQNG